ncbi:uncharacterized protein LOC136074922 isoform X4 [Hydra vulgaris]|uniref:Uncharacterized protein LOC136074922 isoform X4 n=1 Tax=Hydra vulgaris TaxID=6087 RepID=A0ABM4B333_HYDVU
MLEIKLPDSVGPTVQTSFFVTAFKSTMLIFTLFLITWKFSKTNTCDEEIIVDKSYPINNCRRLQNDTNIQIAAKELFKLMDVNPLVCPNDQIKDYKMMIKKSLPTKSRIMKKGDSMKLDKKSTISIIFTLLYLRKMFYLVVTSKIDPRTKMMWCQSFGMCQMVCRVIRSTPSVLIAAQLKKLFEVLSIIFVKNVNISLNCRTTTVHKLLTL